MNESFRPTAQERRGVEPREHLEGTLEEIKDGIFDEFMHQQLIEDFFDELEGYVGGEETDKMRSLLSEYEDEAIYAALSLPYELRERKFEDFKAKIDKGVSSEELMKQLIEVSVRYGFGLGYHTSPQDIQPDETGHWDIRGVEKDHRDDDRNMAYYSTKYRHLFKKKGPKFVYIVRTEPHTHKTDGNWSRAGKLSIVARVPFEEVFEYVEKTSRTIQKENGMT